MNDHTQAEPIRLVLTVEEAARRLGIGRTYMYGLVKSRAVESVQIGKLRRIPIEALAEYINHLRESARTEQKAA
jgi:excisionase family DNA binding protein